MYDLPELAAATTAWWQGMAEHLSRAGIAGVPPELVCADDPYTHWTPPNLLFSQTCGYPLTHALKGRVCYVATPCYAAPGCHGPNYCSQVIVSEASPAVGMQDLKDARCAVNGMDSQSGYNALRALVAPYAEEGRFFSGVTISGGHRESAALVGRGEADVAALDCVTHALLAAHVPQALAGTRVLCQTPSAPGLPYVTAVSASTDLVARLREGLFSALADPRLAQTRASLLIAGAEVLSDSAYDAILDMEAAGLNLTL